jgi:hypothetical protein
MCRGEVIHSIVIAAEAVSTVLSNPNNIQRYIFSHVVVKYMHLHLKYGWSTQLCLQV